MLFLGEALTTMIVYVWCRRNPYVRYNFFGLFNFQAPYLPWILVLFSVLFGGSVLVDLVGKYSVAAITLCPLASEIHCPASRRRVWEELIVACHPVVHGGFM